MVCLCCGGSGIQRVADQRFRTCQCCLGLGTVRAGGRGEEAMPAPREAAAQVSAAVSSSAAK